MENVAEPPTDIIHDNEVSSMSSLLTHSYSFTESISNEWELFELWIL